MNKNKSGEPTNRFAEGKSSPQEASQLLNNLLHSELDGDDWTEWQQIESVDIDSNIAASMAQKITAAHKPAKSIRRIMLPWLKIAAALFITLGVWQVTRLSFTTTKPQAVAQVNSKKQAAYEQLSNSSNKASRRVVLADGSAVVLQPGAAISFQHDSLATGVNRDVYLQGSAFFEVAKNAGRPFTVYGSTLATTALGTSFDVLEEQGQNTVRLHTGKVSVKPAKQTGNNSFTDCVYLLPGDEVNTKGEKKQFAVLPAEKKPTTVAAAAVAPLPTTKRRNNKAVLEFDNTPISEVFVQLEKKYGVSIVFNNNEVSNSFFSGEVLESDSLPSILTVICSMKSLTVKDSAAAFYIRK